MEIFTPISSHVSEQEKENKKHTKKTRNVKIENFEKKKWSGDMAATRELAMKFGLDQCGGLRETRVNERQTTG